MAGITLGGATIFVETFGGSLEDYPAGIVFNKISDRFVVMGNIESKNFGSEGGFDMIAFNLDYWGDNQCDELGLRDHNYTVNSGLQFSNIPNTY